jgi:integrase
MTSSFSSPLAPELRAFLVFKRTRGCRYVRGEYHLLSLDRFLRVYSRHRRRWRLDLALLAWLARRPERKEATVGLELFFLFLAKVASRPVDLLRLDDIRTDSVLAFLEHVESVRSNSASTRNCRLAAIRGFVRHLLRHDLAHAEEY